LLVYPKFPETFWSFTYALKFIKKKSAYPPLGLITVAALLPETGPSAWWMRISRSSAKRIWPGRTWFLSAPWRFSEKRRFKSSIVAKGTGLKIVAGGPLFTSEPEAFEQVDHLVLDEAELTLPPFLADLKNGCPKRIYRAEGYPDIHQSPVPLWDLVKMRRYASMNIQYSRGCPFDCEFCNITALYGRKPRTKTPRQVIAELDAIYRAGWRGKHIFCRRQFHRKQALPEKRAAAGFDRMAQGQKRLRIFHGSLDQSRR
jgi:radical SAM superfamily enzyme YgiQ (UPF0313 family)